MDSDEEGVLVTYQTGKGNDHLVPVFFPSVTYNAMEYLVSEETRSNADVCKNNTYIFANTQGSDRYASGWHSLNEILTKVDKKGAFNATKNRHRIATILARMNLSEGDQQLMFAHFGHSKTVNQDVYQAAAGSLQIATTAKVLLKVKISIDVFLPFSQGKRVKDQDNNSVSKKL